MKKTTLAIVLALCMVFAVSATTMAAPRVGLQNFALDLGFSGMLRGQVGGFIDTSLPLTGGFSLRANGMFALDVLDLDDVECMGEFWMQYDFDYYFAAYIGAQWFNYTIPMQFPTPMSTEVYPFPEMKYQALFPQVGMLFHLPVGDNLSLYALVSAYFDYKEIKFVPGYGAYIVIDFGQGWGVTAGFRGFGSDLVRYPWVTAGMSYAF